MAQDDGKIVSLTHRSPLPPGNTPGTHFCNRLNRPQSHSVIGRILCQLKIPVTPAGIDQVTFRFAAQHLNQCATAVPNRNEYQAYLLGGKCGRCVGLTNLPPYCAYCLEIYEPQPQ